MTENHVTSVKGVLRPESRNEMFFCSSQWN